jgi:decaprenylphospho-beta-D-erythro-pentofuranosid-2-ulose 2-reductase
MSRGIAIFGATSTIAKHILLQLTQREDRICLAARNQLELHRVAADLQLRREPRLLVEHLFDADRPESHADLAARIWSELDGVDIVIVCTGELGDQHAARHDPNVIHSIIQSNFTGVATILAPFVDNMEARHGGRIAVLSSVAGDRARQSNYIYGSAKAGVDAYFAGLRNRLHGTGVVATTVKLGFTDTRMVYGKPGMFLVARPETAARTIIAGMNRRTSVLYAPWFWRPIMFIVRCIPDYLFNRLKL